jgi:hypothetical protein
MRTHLLYFVVSLALVLGAGAAQGRECNGVSFLDRVETEAGRLELNGLGLRKATMFEVKVYVAALYLAGKSAEATAILDANAPKQLVLHFVRDVDAETLNKAWDVGFEKNAVGRLPDLATRIAAFKALMVEMKSGREMQLLHAPGVGVHVAVEGASKGTIQGDDFARALFAMWLGASPANPSLKVGLLGGVCD